MEAEKVSKFPLENLVPKDVTEAQTFLQKNPSFDGRNVKIAIVDSGSDPGAAGLQVTPDGKPKFLDVRDFSGSGDIDTSKVIKISCEGAVEFDGLSGRKCKLPSSWQLPPDKQIHIGLLNLFQSAMPDYLNEWKKKRKEKFWTPQHNRCLADCHGAKKSVEDLDDEVANKAARKDILEWFEKKRTDYGPLYDVVSFFDGEKWRAAIDVSENGSFEGSPLLTNFKDELKFGTIGGIYQINYVLNILDDGNKVELVVPQSHGTHVASISAGYFPEEPERKGVAPGAQIISLKIGNSLLDGSFETGYAFVRALNYACKEKVDIVNISYGEPYSWVDSGCVNEAVERAVRDYGVIVVVAAGNEGPGLSTILSLPANKWAYGIGAYVTPEMGKLLYGLPHEGKEVSYNWSSRGPSLEGANAVLACAPGAAYASVPTYTLQKSVLMNGTSMASPNASGTIALLLSGLKSEGIRISPASVKRAIANTASYNSDRMEKLCVGNGLLQVEKAYHWMEKYGKDNEWNVFFHCQVATGNAYGIYIRDMESLTDQIYTVNLIAEMSNLKLEAEKALFEIKLRLKSPVPWIKIPSETVLSYGSRLIKVEVQASHLATSPGLHYEEILVFDSKNTQKGAVLKIPVTVIVPHFTHTWDISEQSHVHKPGVPERRFIHVPTGATYAEISFRLRRTDNATSPDSSPMVNFELCALQIEPRHSFQTHYLDERISLIQDRIIRYSMPVSDHLGFLELSTVLFWSRTMTAEIDWSIDFHGIMPLIGNELSIQEGERFPKIIVRTSQRAEQLSTQASLNYHVTPVKPYDSILDAIIEERDVFPDGLLTHSLSLFYKFSVSKATITLVEVPLLMDYLYECEFHSQQWRIYDSKKMRVAIGDAKINRKHDYSVKLDKGDYTVILQLKHTDRDLLKKMEDLAICLRFKLNSPISLDMYTSYQDALKEGSGKLGSKPLMKHSSLTYFLGMPKDKNVKTLHAGQFMEGSMMMGRDVVTGSRSPKSSSYKIRFYGVESARKVNEKPVCVEDKYEKKYQFVANLAVFEKTPFGDGNTWRQHHNWMLKEFGDSEHRKLLILWSYLCSIFGATTSRPTSCVNLKHMQLAEEGLHIGEQIVEMIDENKVLAYYGSASQGRDSSIRDEMQDHKCALIDAHMYQLQILHNLITGGTRKEDDEGKSKLAKKAKLHYDALKKLLETKEARFNEAKMMHSEIIRMEYLSLFCALKVYEEKPSRELYDRIILRCESFGWQHVADNWKASKPVIFPVASDLF